jgi:hypothetical protein
LNSSECGQIVLAQLLGLQFYIPILLDAVMQPPGGVVLKPPTFEERLYGVRMAPTAYQLPFNTPLAKTVACTRSLSEPDVSAFRHVSSARLSKAW